MKTRRHDVILRLLRQHAVRSQEDLRELLKDEGIDVTQATLSRDIRELGVIKTFGDDGLTSYQPPQDAPVLTPPLERLARTLLVSLHGVGPLLVIRTPAGSANALGSAVDSEGWPEVVGTIAGDDTILVITRSDRARRAVRDRLRQLAGLEA
jgi:transcriptional regulator of arginine metabolism